MLSLRDDTVSQGGAPGGPGCPAGSMSSQAEKHRESEHLPVSAAVATRPLTIPSPVTFVFIRSSHWEH